MPSILFICVHNACRSRIAEAICRNLSPSSWVVASAGSKPSDHVDPKAVEILKRYQLAMPSTQPRGFGEIPSIQWDYVVDMGCGDSCPSVSAKEHIQWNIPDPKDGPMERYEALYKDLEKRIHELIDRIMAESLYPKFSREVLTPRDYLATDRTILAYERTFLAYIRTALALFAAGASFFYFFDSALFKIAGWIFILSGIMTLILALLRYRKMKNLVHQTNKEQSGSSGS